MMSKYLVCFYQSATQSGRVIEYTRLSDAQRALFNTNARADDDAEIQVINAETGHVLGGWFYRMSDSGKWSIIRALDVVA